MEASVEISKKKRLSPLNISLFQQGTGWLYSTPVSKKAYSEPVREEFSPARGANNGSWVVRRWRNDINMPFQYETFSGYLHIELAGFIPLVRELGKILKQEAIVTSEEAWNFVVMIRSSLGMYRNTIENALKFGRGDLTETDHPLVAYFQLRDKCDLADILETLRYATCAIFPSRKEYLLDFVERHLEELMTVKVIRKFRVIRAE